MEQEFKDLIKQWEIEADNEDYDDGKIRLSNVYHRCIDDLKDTLHVIEANKLITS